MIPRRVKDFICFLFSWNVDSLQRLVEKFNNFFFLPRDLEIDGEFLMHFMVFRKNHSTSVPVDALDKICFFICFCNDVAFKNLNPIFMAEIIAFAEFGVQILYITNVRLTIPMLYFSDLINR